ncbi:MAG: hypothetical protein ACR2MX_00110 [Cyclobacteriaceae bacterium]
MNYFYAVICFFYLLIQFACTPKQEFEEGPKEDVASLEGTWNMISFRVEGDTTWKEHNSTVINQKHITPTHFVWMHYETDTDSLPGTGGGTYVFDSINNTYTEDIHFFFPPGANELGQAIPFTVEMKDGKWYHTGYAKVFEFDPDIGEMVIADSNKIEEIWEKVETSSEESNLVGTWELDSYKDHGDSLRSEYPDFVKYMKLITPTHFLWVHYISEQDQVLAEGGGTYKYDGDTYTETIEFIYPSGSNQIGTVLPFDCKVDENTWYHKGNIKRMEKDPDSGKMITKDSSRIDEVWTKYQPSI